MKIIISFTKLCFLSLLVYEFLLLLLLLLLMLLLFIAIAVILALILAVIRNYTEFFVFALMYV